jgi:WD40 repeat protein
MIALVNHLDKKSEVADKDADTREEARNDSDKKTPVKDGKSLGTEHRVEKRKEEDKAEQERLEREKKELEKKEQLKKELERIEQQRKEEEKRKEGLKPKPKPKPTWEGHKSTVWATAYSKDGKLALTGGGSIKTVGPDGPDNCVRLWDAATGKEVKCLNKFKDFIKSVAFSPNGKFAIFANAGKWVGNVYIPTTEHSVHLWDLDKDRELKLVIDRPDDGAAKQSVPRFRGHTDEVWSVAFSPDGKKAAAASRNGTILVWDVNGKLLCTCKADFLGINGHKNGVYALAFSPNSQQLVSGSYDFTVRLWSVATGTQVRCFKGHTDYVWSVAYSADGRYVLSSAGCQLNGAGMLLPGTKDYTIRLWDVATGAELRQFKGHTSAIYQAVFSPDGKYIASGGADSTVRIWDTGTGNEVRCLRGHTNWVRSVAISPDGRYALSGGEDKILRLWDMPGKTEKQ